jgi:dimethylamine/trimethylamine dehydrogenase
MRLSKLRNCEVVTHRRLSAGEVLAYGAAIVITATGARWAMDGWNRTDRAPIPGADARLPHILTPDQLMAEGKTLPGERVLVYDCEGYFMGATLAEKLARDGHAVRLVTPFAGVGPTMDFTGENLFLQPQLRRLGIDILAAHLVREIRREAVVGCSLAAPDQPLTWPVDAVVLVTSRTPQDTIYRELQSRPDVLQESGIEAVHRVGDCFAPRLYVADAVFDAHRLGREIDTPNPAEPLPYLRERAIVAMD